MDSKLLTELRSTKISIFTVDRPMSVTDAQPRSGQRLKNWTVETNRPNLVLQLNFIRRSTIWELVPALNW